VTATGTRRIRHVDVAPLDVDVRTTPDGVVYLKARRPLGPYPVRLTDRLDTWAAEAPDRSFLAEREPGTAGWRTITYAQALAQVRGLAQGLIEGPPNPRIRRWRCASLTARGCRLDEMLAYRIERATL
jgi:hypothetical protein